MKQEEVKARKAAAENAEKRKRILEIMAQKQDATAEKLDELTADVKDLKAAPGEHWKTITKAALTAIVAAVIGYALAHVGL